MELPVIYSSVQQGGAISVRPVVALASECLTAPLGSEWHLDGMFPDSQQRLYSIICLTPQSLNTSLHSKPLALSCMA